LPDTVIQIEHVSKMYRLGMINNGALFQDIQSWMARKLGKGRHFIEYGGRISWLD